MASHSEVDGLAPDSPPLRAKHLATEPLRLPPSRDLSADRVEVGLAFDRALRSTGVSTEEVSRRLGIAPSLVKRIRKGEVSLAIWHWARLSDRVRTAVEAELSKTTVTR